MSLHPRFEQASDGTGIDIIDPVETRHFSLFTDEPVDPTRVGTDGFAFPVETARRVSIERLRLPHMIPVDVRTPEGDPLVSVDDRTAHDLPDDDYLLELHSPIKVYLRVSGAVRIEAATAGVTFEFDGETPVEVGARSYHSAPGATVTVPDDPEALIAAVSTFPSALKTTSPERAWPTLRGHPPRIERGDELTIPDGLDAPDTGITVTVPPEYWAVYAVAPLAYYLGAEVRPGDTARLTADSGVARHLGDDPDSVADATAALLERAFFLDCVTRTEGLYPDDLHERAVLESHVDLDFARLYDASPDDRLAEYLAVPDEAVAAISSPWHRVTHVQPDAEAATFLPHLVNDLSLVRPETSDDAADPPTDDRLDDGLDSFLRRPVSEQAGADESGGEKSAAGERAGVGEKAAAGEQTAAGEKSAAVGDAAEDFVRSADAGDLQRSGDSPDGVPGLDEYVSLPETDALEQAWVGDGTPIRGTKLVEEAFAHETPEPSDGTIDVAVVCNDSQMRAEWDSVGDIYGSRDDMRVDVTAETEVTTDELRDLLAEDRDVFHFVGHIDGHGFQCPDGILDAATLDATGATTALLNGCRSHDQGIELVRAGASAAVVSLSDLFNSGAVEVGETLARLLHHGFDIGSAMKIVREYTSIGDRYVVVGDPEIVVVQHEGVFPNTHHVIDSNLDKSELTIEPRSYSVQRYRVGTTFKPFGFKSDRYHVAAGIHNSKTLTKDEFEEITGNLSDPLIVDDELIWSDEWMS